MTSKQYEEGYYTKREAAVIGTTFSVVSITFSLVVISQVGLAKMFVPFYLTVTGAGVIAAIIIPRIPPLSRKPDTYFVEKSDDYSEEKIPQGYTPLSWGVAQAVEKARSNRSMKDFTAQWTFGDCCNGPEFLTISFYKTDDPEDVFCSHPNQ